MRKKINCMAVTILLVGATYANAAMNFSYTGNFTYDNDVQQFNFTVGAASPAVVLRAWSYAGGVNAAGNTIARGGFDTILALWDSSGNLIGENDDGGSSLVATDLSGMAWDTYLNAGSLAAGNYTVTVAQYNNFAAGSTLAQGFVHDGASGQYFTRGLTGNSSGQFWDVSGSAYSGRDGHWAFDILNVESAIIGPIVPEPSTCVAGLLLLLPFGISTIRSMRKNRAA